MTRGAYAKAVCRELGLPWTIHNRRVFAAWFQTEGGSAAQNPANTTQEMPGSTIYNWVGVKNYISAEQGIEATVKTFRGHGHGYEAILRCLRANVSAAQTLRAIGASDWGTGGTLAMQIRGELARIPAYLRTLERKEIAS
jgi:hypothetical protein